MANDVSSRGQLMVWLVRGEVDEFLTKPKSKKKEKSTDHQEEIEGDNLERSLVKTREWINENNFDQSDQKEEMSQEKEKEDASNFEQGNQEEEMDQEKEKENACNFEQGNQEEEIDQEKQIEDDSSKFEQGGKLYHELVPVPIITHNALPDLVCSEQLGASPSEYDNAMTKGHRFGDDCSSIIEESSVDDDWNDPTFNIEDYGRKKPVYYFSDEEIVPKALSTTSSSASSKVSSIIRPGSPVICGKIKEIAKPQTRTTSKNGKKMVHCRYCGIETISKNFIRHLERSHKDEHEIQKILALPKNSKDRRFQLGLLRNETNFDLYIHSNTTRPVRQLKNVSDGGMKNNSNSGMNEYVPCAYCKGLFLRSYLKRHGKSCHVKSSTSAIAQATTNKNKRVNHLGDSQTMTACAMDPTQVISKMNVKGQVFSIMKPDEVAFQAKKDLLIAHMGETYLKRHKRERMAYSASNKMRELSRLLITYRQLINDNTVTLKDLLHPENFDTVAHAARLISGYDAEKKTFKAPSLAMHLGTSLKFACDELLHLIIRRSKGYRTKSSTEQQNWISEVKLFKELVEARWNSELASLANKDMMEKRWNKPLLLPMVSDIKKFRDGSLQIAAECKEQLMNGDKNEKAYKLLVQCTLALLIVFNRRRIGDVQYLKIKDYQSDKRSNHKDFENALTDGEKALTTKYKRVLNSGKGSRAVVILVPQLLQNFIDLSLEHRPNYIPSDNEYVFAMPGSTIKWGKGDVAIKALCRKIKLEQPETISSNKLRKHIATVMQILNLSKDEAKQFAKFMGHTEKTHEEFYSLPVDIYQTAKVSKLLLMIEKGTVPIEYKGKSLADININPDAEYAEEDNNNEDQGTVMLESDDEGVNVKKRVDYVRNSEKENKLTETLTECNDDNGKVADSEISTSTSDARFKEKKEKSKKELVEYEMSSSDSDGSIVKKGTKKRKRETETKSRQRLRWTQQELDKIEDEYKSYINKGTYPSGTVMQKFLDENNLKRPVATLRSKLQHLIRLKQGK